MGRLSELEKLSLSGNMLTKLPHSISQLTMLRELSVAGNLLREIPKGLSNLGTLASAE